MDGERTGDAARGEMLHEREEIGQVLPRHALFVKRQDVAPGFSLNEIIGVLYALGDALAGGQRADVIARDEGLKLFVGNLGIDCHAMSKARREVGGAA